MTLDEAIEHAKEVARTCDDSKCASDHMQLAEWLRQARGAEKAARWYTAKTRELEDENAKLLESCKKWLGKAAHLEAENERLRELACDMFEKIEAGGFDPMVERHGKNTVYYEEDPYWRVGIRERMRELGIEVES